MQYCFDSPEQRAHCHLGPIALHCRGRRNWIDFAEHAIVASSLIFVDTWPKVATSMHNSQRMKARPASCVPHCAASLMSSCFSLTVALICGLVILPIELSRTMQLKARQTTRARLLRLHPEAATFGRKTNFRFAIISTSQ